MFIKPAPGRMVRWPTSMRLLSDQGEEVPDDLHWQRLIQTGDVIILPSSSSEIKKSTMAMVKKEEKDG
ncbi:DUF2635 domain-containing protein [Commensalibacter papalotli (ex Botero et al. 2024)]|uniref:DUF2635 domain-containing protein n=1 Tax=Commensalibacter papalotli (ex Botero et al. 2024) TaxID=2972766 RepID=UPI0022FFBF12|nr:DUF2635 domain-containing protein [Commensalibacter papalotli (ex Botero et al. 2024)]CAI3945503.1 unnamed protein product [Commensalibacter papalotli (ex Botero et al. 2024)]